MRRRMNLGGLASVLAVMLSTAASRPFQTREAPEQRPQLQEGDPTVLQPNSP